MKSANFKRKDNSFRSIREIEKEKEYKEINWDRVTYFIILSVALFFLGWFVFKKIYYVKADGQVMFRSIDIQNLDDCRIINFHVEEGDLVCEGDTLFTYLNDDDEANFNSGGVNLNLAINQSDGTNWILKEIATLEKNIELNTNEINELKRRQNELEKELTKTKQQVILDALPKSAYVSLESSITEIKDKIKLLNGENVILFNALEKWRYKLKLEANSNLKSAGAKGQGNSDGNQLKVFLAPMEGTVTRIFKQNKEVAVKSEVIMHIHKNEHLFIKAFFEQEDLAELKEEDVVEIEFPDNTTSLGTIKRFYFATYRLPEEFQKKYEPTNRSLSVDIVPLNNDELKKWKQYYKLSVIVRKKRY